ncbi:hypothetical protein GMORB2_7709 [Geosmithia morbida]|uniref:Uncharacterized protein n=1 Tax=Geosmithia morbida TaxID=1094350 RepID=A0A9P5D332_9HYPO|nr:uncharacterized protein GMORB2_7709 [Geosmithia morbida]KAF4122116.1 hypothetical protein GMORB2_7709 [Geosmithia morbida]
MSRSAAPATSPDAAAAAAAMTKPLPHSPLTVGPRDGGSPGHHQMPPPQQGQDQQDGLAYGLDGSPPILGLTRSHDHDREEGDRRQPPPPTLPPEECRAPAAGPSLLRLWPSSQIPETWQSIETSPPPPASGPAASPPTPPTPAPADAASSRRSSTATRRRLQKPAPSSIASSSNRASHATGSAAAPSPTLECGGGPGGPTLTSTQTRVTPGDVGTCQTPAQHHQPCIPDLGDSKWSQYLDYTGLANNDGSQDPHHRPHPLPLRRQTSSASSSHRKTLSKRGFLSPSLKIGQLDGSAPRRREIRVIKKRASIELIAEQYQAVLESRDRKEEEAAAAAGGDLEYPDGSRPTMTADGQQRGQDSTTQESGLALERLKPTCFDAAQDTPPQDGQEVVFDLPIHAPDEPDLSPASDGTFVAFEEDAIYFKPISFSTTLEPSPSPERQSFEDDRPLPPTPTSTTHHQHRQQQRSRAQSQSDPGSALQTCIAMLVRELTSAMPSPSPSPSPALQIGAMIEAYERLRDQTETTASSGLSDVEQRNVRSMFDCWLAALHTMHRSFTRKSDESERLHHQELMPEGNGLSKARIT